MLDNGLRAWELLIAYGQLIVHVGTIIHPQKREEHPRSFSAMAHDS